MEERCSLCQEVTVVRRVKLEGLIPFYFCRLCWPVIQEGIEVFMQIQGVDEDTATTTMCALALKFGEEGLDLDEWEIPMDGG